MAKNLHSKIFSFALAASVLCANTAQACTEFQLLADDTSVIVGRSMEFAVELGSEITIVNRDQEYASTAPGEKQGLKWKSKYGFVGVTAFSMPVIIDGFNEKGLSIGFLWLPGSVYQEIKPEESATAIALEDLGAWMLGNFATVEELKNAIKGVKVWSHSFKQLGGMIPPIHVSVQDIKGASLVIEYSKGELKLFDNPVGVLTNAPTFDWQLSNLNNYINLTAVNASPQDIGQLKLVADAQGSGLRGLPGDPLPSSRFVKTAFLKQFSKSAANAKEAVNLASHLLNTVDIPRGTIRPKKESPDNGDYTQWVIIKDLTNKAIYFRTYDNTNWQMVDFKSFELAPTAKHKNFPIDAALLPVDVTAALKV